MIVTNANTWGEASISLLLRIHWQPMFITAKIRGNTLEMRNASWYGGVKPPLALAIFPISSSIYPAPMLRRKVRGSGPRLCPICLAYKSQKNVAWSNNWNKLLHYIGSSFESLFEELGEKEELDLLTQKKMLAFELQERMEQQKLTPSTLAKKMKARRVDIEHLLDPHQTDVSLDTTLKAFQAVGLRLHAT